MDRNIGNFEFKLQNWIIGNLIHLSAYFVAGIFSSNEKLSVHLQVKNRLKYYLSNNVYIVSCIKTVLKKHMKDHLIERKSNTQTVT